MYRKAGVRQHPSLSVPRHFRRDGFTTLGWCCPLSVLSTALPLSSRVAADANIRKSQLFMLICLVLLMKKPWTRNRFKGYAKYCAATS